MESTGLEQLLRRLRQAGQAIFGPQRRCACCDAVCTPANGTALDSFVLCQSCTPRLAPRTGGYCPACGEPYADESTPPHLCAACLQQPPPWENLFFLTTYNSPLDELIPAFKYGRGLGRSGLLGSLAKTAFSIRKPALPDIIVPVPLHNRRLRWRGFNQSRELAQPLARHLCRPLDDTALLRLTNTTPQSSLQKRERLTNLHGAFMASAEVQDKRILLVDDVMTTGATVRECSSCLLSVGASSVDVLVLARASISS